MPERSVEVFGGESDMKNPPLPPGVEKYVREIHGELHVNTQSGIERWSAMLAMDKHAVRCICRCAALDEASKYGGVTGDYGKAHDWLKNAELWRNFDKETGEK